LTVKLREEGFIPTVADRQFRIFDAQFGNFNHTLDALPQVVDDRQPAVSKV
jgi:hypothetical protein